MLFNTLLDLVPCFLAIRLNINRCELEQVQICLCLKTAAQQYRGTSR